MSQSHNRMSPRQKMINLMYIVLTAMLALNVSSDVLDGFTQVEDGLARTNTNVAMRNQAVFASLEAASEANPEKAGRWHARALELRERAAEVYSTIDSLKFAIVRKADGSDGDPEKIDNRENLEASSVVMLNPITRRGEKLRQTIDVYRNLVVASLTDSVKRAGIEAVLSTEPRREAGVDALRSWEVVKFENQPVVAAVALLTKLQSDVLYAEGEALSSLLNSVDAGDTRVNSLSAFVIPESRFVMRGSPYEADIVLAAVDSTARPAVWVNGKQLPAGTSHYELPTASSGTFDYSGYLEVPSPDGSVSRHQFSSSYTVIDPTATVSATMMNVLYAGIDNPLDIAVPGVAPSSVSATMTGGALTRTASGWIARPAPGVEKAEITVSIEPSGHSPRRPVATTQFKVRRLPDPAAFIVLSGADGASERYRGERPIPKASLLSSKGLGAAIDDGVLDIDFKVTGFETVFFDSMGNAMPERSDGASFSRRQLESFRRLSRGKRFYISKIKAVGPDGVERTLNPVEVIVN